MRYIGTAISDSLSVDGIFTVLKPDLSKINPNGESHDFPEIIYIESGKHTVTVDGVKHLLFGGQMIMYAPGAHHVGTEPSMATADIISFESSSHLISKISNCVITLSDAQKNIFLNIVEDGEKCFEHRAPFEKGIGGMVLRSDADEYVLQRIKKQLEFFLIDVCNSVCAPSTEHKAKMELDAVTEFLTKNIEKRLTLSDVAEGCSMSISKLKMLFRKNHGSGVIDCFIKLKIERAKQMIREGKLNFTEISETLGFSSLHYFSRLFKKQTGLTPSEYAKQNQSL